MIEPLRFHQEKAPSFVISRAAYCDYTHRERHVTRLHVPIQCSSGFEMDIGGTKTSMAGGERCIYLFLFFFSLTFALCPESPFVPYCVTHVPTLQSNTCFIL